MEYVVGIAGAIALAIFGRYSNFERDRSFYPTVLIVIGLLYILFAAIDGRTSVLLTEGIFTLVFCAIALVGFKYSGVIVGAGIAAHGGFDLIHRLFIENTGVPIWWPGFCGSIDILLGVYVMAASPRQLDISADL